MLSSVESEIFNSIFREINPAEHEVKSMHPEPVATEIQEHTVEVAIPSNTIPMQMKLHKPMQNSKDFREALLGNSGKDK